MGRLVVEYHATTFEPSLSCDHPGANKAHETLEPFARLTQDDTMKVCSLREAATIEQRVCSRIGIPPLVLWENAARAGVQILEKHFDCPPCLFLCGIGRNAIIGLAMARHLASRGIDTTIVTTANPSEFPEDMRMGHDAAVCCGARSLTLPQPFDPRLFEASGMVVDALMQPGTEAVAPSVCALVDWLNATRKPVLSIDLPAGVHGDTGQVAPFAIQATATLAPGLLRRGHFLAPGSSHTGKLFLSLLSLPQSLLELDEVMVELVRPSPLEKRSPHGHKGAFGDALFIAGAQAYFGAPALSAMAFLRSGGGYARLACPQSIAPTLATIAPEVVFVPQQETETGSLALSNEEKLIDLANQVDFVVVGPGISLHPQTQQLVRSILKTIRSPLLIDGDGLTAIAGHSESVRSRSGDTILTPHPGEMGRLLGLSTAKVMANPIEAVTQAAALYDATVVWKGAHSLVATPTGQVTINTTGNDGMATAGSGDVLTGTIAAMHGLGLATSRAVSTGVFIHGLAGDLARDALGADGMTARDILSHLPCALRSHREDESGTYARARTFCSVIP